MKKQSYPSERDLNPESVRRRTELFMNYIMPHKGMIYNICIIYTNEGGSIEDNYSDVLTNFFRNIESYNPCRPLKSWIYSVAQRAVFECNRRMLASHRKINHNIDTEYLIDEAEANNSVSCNCLGMDTYRQHYSLDILEALEQLSPIHKEALLLQQSGYRLEEIVEITFQNGTLKSKSVETIKSRIFLAKRGMQQLITSNGEKRYERE